MDGGTEQIVAETAHVCSLFSSQQIALPHEQARFALFDCDGNPLELETDEGGQPLWGKLPQKDCVLWVSGGVTTPMLRTLARRGAPITVAAPDATHFLFDRASAQLFERGGGRLAVERALTIAAVCANPWSAYGNHLNREGLLDGLRAAITVPVVDVKEDEV